MQWQLGFIWSQLSTPQNHLAWAAGSTTIVQIFRRLDASQLTYGSLHRRLASTDLKPARKLFSHGSVVCRGTYLQADKWLTVMAGLRTIASSGARAITRRISSEDPRGPQDSDLRIWPVEHRSSTPTAIS